MNLELAKSIIVEEVKKSKYALSFLEDDGEDLDVIDWCNGENLSEAISSYSYDGNVIIEVDREGGEGEGEYYHIVFKIDHPEHGVGYIKVVGYYDSWNGTEWYNQPTMCHPVEVTVIEYHDL